MNGKHLVVVVLLAMWVHLTVQAQGEKKLSPKKLPTAVLAAFQKAYPKAKIKGASTEVENGRKMFEVESVDGKTGRDLLYAEDGTCVEVEESVPYSSVPPEVASGLRTAYPEGKIEKSEKLTRGETIQYEFVVVSGKEKHEVVLDTAGKIVKDTNKTAKQREAKED